MKLSELLPKERKLLALLKRYPGLVDNLKPKIGIKVDGQVTNPLRAQVLIDCLEAQGIRSRKIKKDSDWTDGAPEWRIKMAIAAIISLCPALFGPININGRPFGSNPIRKLIKRLVPPVKRTRRSWEQRSEPRRRGPQPGVV